MRRGLAATLAIAVLAACGDAGDGRLSIDLDGDGVEDFADNCRDAPNPDQADGDGDGAGDACDTCPALADPGQEDLDRDGLGDACDDDRDGDGVPDAVDSCPDDADPGQEDTDRDGIGDACDSCLEVPDASQRDEDRDGVGDACDVCPETPDPLQVDGDGDGWGDACDDCPKVPDPIQNDKDADGWGDACDNCLLTRNTAQADLDGDGLGDRCDPDRDGDGLEDEADLCPDAPDPLQEDRDGDGAGDACDVCPDQPDPLQQDADGDGVGTACDVCPAVWDPAQTDADGDGVGDACEDPCGRVEIVWVVDVSGSMGDEAISAWDLSLLLTERVRDALPGGAPEALRTRALSVAGVGALLGKAVPGAPAALSVLADCAAAPDPLTAAVEDWGRATAIVADRYPWADAAVRVVVPMSDEGPWCGGWGDDPGPDRDVIELAAAAARARGVFVSPITGLAPSPGTEALAQRLAGATGGRWHGPSSDLDAIAADLAALALAACP